MKFARIALMIVAVVIGGLLRAEEAPADRATAAGDVDLLAQAYRLAAFAAEHKSPEAYIAAGSLLRKVDTLTRGSMGKFDVPFEVQNEKGEPIPGALAKVENVGSLKDQAEDYFESASALGAELKIGREVEALIKQAKERSYERGARGNVAGPRACALALAPKERQKCILLFATGAPAVVAFEATGNVRIHISEKIKTGKGDDLKTVMNLTANHGKHGWIPTSTTPVTPTTFLISNPTNKAVTVRIITN